MAAAPTRRVPTIGCSRAASRTILGRGIFRAVRSKSIGHPRRAVSRTAAADRIEEALRGTAPAAASELSVQNATSRSETGAALSTARTMDFGQEAIGGAGILVRPMAMPAQPRDAAVQCCQHRQHRQAVLAARDEAAGASQSAASWSARQRNPGPETWGPTRFPAQATMEEAGSKERTPDQTLWVLPSSTASLDNMPRDVANTGLV
jgi:hypothetical protein